MLQSLGLLSITVVILAVYVATLSPSVAGGDSGELLSEGCVLGTPHPPGYPIFMIGINILLRIRDSFALAVDLAYLANMWSACLTAGAAYFMGRLVFQFTGSLCGCIFAMGTFSFSPLIWQYAVTAEVFPLNTFFAAYLLYLTYEFAAKRDLNIAVYGAFICGLALCNQHTIVLFEAPLILFITISSLKSLYDRPVYIAYIGTAFFIGLAPYAALPIVAYIKSDGGSWGNVSTIKGFIHHFLRKDYGTFQLFSGNNGRETEDMWERNEAYIDDVFYQQGLYCVLPLALVACVYNLVNMISRMFQGESASKGSKSKKLINDQSTPPSTESQSLASVYVGIVLPLTIVFYCTVFHSLSNLPLSDKLLYGVHQRFWMQPNVLLFTLAGIGFARVVELCDLWLQTISVSVGAGEVVTRIFSLFQLFMVGFIVILQMHRWYFISDQSQANYFRQYATAALTPLPPHSLLLINYDQHWTSVRYTQNCEGVRKDVTTINLSMMTYEWFRFKMPLFQYESNNDNPYGRLSVKFPGDMYSSAHGRKKSSNDDTILKLFTLSEFVEANVYAPSYYTNSMVKDSGSKRKKFNPVFLSGKPNFPDGKLDERFTLAPFGISSQFIPRNSPTDVVEVSAWDLQEVWEKVGSLVFPFPYSNKYSREMWEWTIARDFKDRLNDLAAFLLEEVLGSTMQDPKKLVNALYFLEAALYFEMHEPTYLEKNTSKFTSFLNLIIPQEESPRCDVFGTLGERCDIDVLQKMPVSLLKNVGLGHMHSVRHENITLKLFEKQKDVFGLLSRNVSFRWPIGGRENYNGGDGNPEYFKEWNVNRFVEIWGVFLDREDAKDDPQYKTVRQIYAAATKSANIKTPVDSKKPTKKKQKS